MEELDAKIGSLHESISKYHGLHLMGDILYKSTTPMRALLVEKGYKNTSDFIDSWIEHSGSGHELSDNAAEAEIVRERIRKDAPKKSQTKPFMDRHFQKWKSWLLMYHSRCQLVHSGLDEMDSQALWDALKMIEKRVQTGEVSFERPEWTKYALEAIRETRTFKFKIDKNDIVTALFGDKSRVRP